MASAACGKPSSPKAGAPDGPRRGRRIVSVDRAASASAARAAARRTSSGQKMRRSARKVVESLTRGIDFESTPSRSSAVGSSRGSGLDFAVVPSAVVRHVASLLHGAFAESMGAFGDECSVNFDSLPAAERDAMVERARELLRVARRTQAGVPSITSELKLYPTIDPSGVVPALLERLAGTFHDGWLAHTQQGIDDNMLAVMASGDVDAMDHLVSRLPPAFKHPYAALADTPRAVPRAVAAALIGYLRDVELDDDVAAAEGALVASIRSRRTTSVNAAVELVAMRAAPSAPHAAAATRGECATPRARALATGAFFAAPSPTEDAADDEDAVSHVLLAAERMMAQAGHDDAFREEQRRAPAGREMGRRGKRALTLSASKISLAVRDAADKSKSRWAALRMQTRGATTDVSRNAKASEAAAPAHAQHAVTAARAALLFDERGEARAMMDAPPRAMAGWLLKCDFKRKEQEIGGGGTGAPAPVRSDTGRGGGSSAPEHGGGEHREWRRRSASVEEQVNKVMARTKGLFRSSSMQILTFANKGKGAFAERWFALPAASSRTKHRTSLRYWASEQGGEGGLGARSALGAIDLDTVVRVDITTVADAPPNAIDLVTATRRYTLALPVRVSGDAAEQRAARFEMCRWAAALAARAQCPVGARLETAWKVLADSFPPALRVRGAALRATRGALRVNAGNAAGARAPRAPRSLVAARPLSVAVAVVGDDLDELLAGSPMLSPIAAVHPLSPVAVALAREVTRNGRIGAPCRETRVVAL